MSRVAASGGVARVPFSIPQIGGGLFRAVGAVWCVDGRLAAQYDVVTELFRWRLLGPVRVVIPASELDGVSFREGRFRSVLILHALHQAVVGGLPGSRGGEAWLRFAGRDLRAARELAATLELFVAERNRPALDMSGRHARAALPAAGGACGLEWP